MNELDGFIGNWIKIIDDKNEITIEDYGYEIGIIEGTTENHCVKCVAVNKCLFKDENGKKPKQENFTDVDLFEIISKGLWPGLYHFNCHCNEIPTEISSPNDVQLIIPSGKNDWLFQDKSDWINSMGYEPNEQFLETLNKKIRQAYFYGYYEIQNHTKFGVKIKLKISIEGKGIKKGKIYDLKSSFMVFPNGKLKCNTLIGGWYK